ncbi:MAG TPA: hypothetical protein PK156_28635 [Polyangium sp.]|nr:hypothetical protein [Polyangium sp.]
MQIRTIPWIICVGIALALASPGCSGDAPPSTTNGSGGAGGAGGGGGNEVVDRGHSATEMVTAGEFAKSQKYKMVFTFGQPSQNQAKMMSSSYRMRGGLVGATGSVP